MYKSLLGETPIDCGIKRSVVKVTGQGSLHLPPNLFLDDKLSLNYLIVFKLQNHHPSLKKLLLIFGSKGQRSRSKVKCVYV